MLISFWVNKEIHSTNLYSNVRHIVEVFQSTELVRNSQVCNIKLSFL